MMSGTGEDRPTLAPELRALIVSQLAQALVDAWRKKQAAEAERPRAEVSAR